MHDMVPFADITHLFAEFQSTARRLETRRGYAVDVDSPKWNLWKAGGDLGYNPEHPWHANVRTQTARGRRFERVRVVDQPPTEGQRFLLASGLGNVAAGEDIRNLWRADADQAGVPAEDFWLFDDRIVVFLVFDEDDNTLGVRVIDSPLAVAAGRRAWEGAWPVAIPTVDFMAQVPSVM